MRTFLVLALLLISTTSALAQLSQHPDPRQPSPPYATSLVIVGRVVDVDGNYAAKYPVTVTLQGVDGVMGQETVYTTCYGDWDLYFTLGDLSDRWTVRVQTGGQTREQAVDVVHRRNDFAIQLDRKVAGPPESDANCHQSWILSQLRETFTGQLLEPTAPYTEDGTRLVARPREGVLVTPKWVKPDGSVTYPKVPIYTNEEGGYKYSLLSDTDQPPQGYVLLWFEDDPAQVTNITLGTEPTHYHVVSRPPVQAKPPLIDTPAPGAWAAVAALAVALVAFRRR